MVKIDDSIVNTVKEFLVKVSNEGINITAAYIYGSYAKNTEHKWSDIDVAVISPDFIKGRFEEGVRLAKISKYVDSRIEPMPFSLETFVNDNPLAWEIKKDGIPVSLKINA